MKKIIFLALLAALPPGAGALELLLEDNRGDSGTIGYVDIDKVFKEYSGTSGARDQFITEIKKKESEAAALKTVIYTFKAELDKLRQEREFALTLPSLMETRKSVADAAAAAAEPPAQPAAQQPAPATQVSTAPAQVSTAAVQEAGAAPQAPSPAAQAPAPVPAPAPAPAAAPARRLDTIDLPGVGAVPLPNFKFSVSTSVPEIDAAIAKKESDLKQSEDYLRVFQRQAERELLDYESRKNEALLGKIYVALKELAQKEEVSVVVDKRNILFGQSAVDLTDKLLEKLEDTGL
ncbi:MAG: OmpH family outer membrane protein [Elusimicrobia bacterium]|nr:OmpH family outer membrane protein [Elusimicrobiota bacterium]